MIFRYIETFDWMLCIYRAINGCFSRTKQIKLFFKKTLKWKDISALTITGTIPDVIILSNLSFQGVRKINLCSILPWWIHPPPPHQGLIYSWASYREAIWSGGIQPGGIDKGGTFLVPTDSCMMSWVAIFIQFLLLTVNRFGFFSQAFVT